MPSTLSTDVYKRQILPCLILRNMETKTESSELMWPRDDNRKLALVAALDRSIYESAEGNQIGEKSLSTGCLLYTSRCV